MVGGEKLTQTCVLCIKERGNLYLNSLFIKIVSTVFDHLKIATVLGYTQPMPDRNSQPGLTGWNVR